eukprot:1169524-Pleurochrysis_carterae.AAC.1
MKALSVAVCVAALRVIPNTSHLQSPLHDMSLAVLGARGLGRAQSWARAVLGAGCLGRALSRARAVLGARCLGRARSWARAVLGARGLGRALSRAVLVGARCLKQTLGHRGLSAPGVSRSHCCCASAAACVQSTGGAERERLRLMGASVREPRACVRGRLCA